MNEENEGIIGYRLGLRKDQQIAPLKNMKQHKAPELSGSVA